MDTPMSILIQVAIAHTQKQMVGRRMPPRGNQQVDSIVDIFWTGKDRNKH